MTHGTSHPLRGAVLLTVLVAAFAGSTAQAQEKKPGSTNAGSPAIASSPSLMPGQRLRVTAASPAFTGVTVGNLVKVGSDSLTLVDSERGAVTELPLGSITRIELGHQSRKTKKGLLIGLGIGAVFAVVIAADDSPTCGGYNEPYRECTSSERVALAALTLASSSGIGAWIGHTKKTTDWADVPMPSAKLSAGDLTWQVSPALSRDGHGGGLRLRLTW